SALQHPCGTTGTTRASGSPPGRSYASDLRPSNTRAEPLGPPGPPDPRLAAHTPPPFGPPTPVRNHWDHPGLRISAWPLIRLRPSALQHACGTTGTTRASGSPPGRSYASALRPSNTRAEPLGPPGPPDLRLAAHTPPTFGPPTRVRNHWDHPGLRIPAWPLIRLRPSALQHPCGTTGTTRASGSPPGRSCGSDL